MKQPIYRLVSSWFIDNRRKRQDCRFLLSVTILVEKKLRLKTDEQFVELELKRKLFFLVILKTRFDWSRKKNLRIEFGIQWRTWYSSTLIGRSVWWRGWTYLRVGWRRLTRKETFLFFIKKVLREIFLLGWRWIFQRKSKITWRIAIKILFDKFRIVKNEKKKIFSKLRREIFFFSVDREKVEFSGFDFEFRVRKSSMKFVFDRKTRKFDFQRLFSKWRSVEKIDSFNFAESRSRKLSGFTIDRKRK